MQPYFCQYWSFRFTDGNRKRKWLIGDPRLQTNRTNQGQLSSFDACVQGNFSQAFLPATFFVLSPFSRSFLSKSIFRGFPERSRGKGPVVEQRALSRWLFFCRLYLHWLHFILEIQLKILDPTSVLAEKRFGSLGNVSHARLARLLDCYLYQCISKLICIALILWKEKNLFWLNIQLLGDQLSKWD